MTLLSSQDNERFEQMKEEVNFRQSEWRFYHSLDVVVTPALKPLLQLLKKDFQNVGPFGSRFVKKNYDNFKDEFYGIPLQYTFVKDTTNNFTGYALVATSGEESVLLKNVFEFLNDGNNLQEFVDLKMRAICVQTALNSRNETMVVAVDCIDNICPMAFYEHPANGRLLQAMTNEDPPEFTALTFYGNRQAPNVPFQEMLMRATGLYNEYHLGDIEYTDLSEQLYSLFGK